MESVKLSADVKTFSPIRIPLALRTGTMDVTREYRSFLSKLADFDPNLVATLPPDDTREYETLAVDIKRLEIASWHDSDSDHRLAIHIFPNAIGVVELTLTAVDIASPLSLEESVQDLSERLVEAALPRFCLLIEKIKDEFTDSILTKPPGASAPPYKPRIFWTSRALLLTKEQATDQRWSDFIRQWLALTERPRDADDIIEGSRDCSMTWLNYVVVDCLEDDYRIDTMTLAQYVYKAQDQCNQRLKETISLAYATDRALHAAKQLEESRVAVRLHLISFHDNVNYLTRPKRRLLEDILTSWDFDRLVENSQRMIEVCSSRIEEANQQRRERSSVLTDLLLVSLSFFAVFELSLYLAQFSREAMSRPALDYKDDQPSFFLRLIAEIDTDIMFGMGFGATLLLVLIYRFIKYR